ncbi:MAG: DEAD/DEAH box helicase [Sandaracinus sp.]|nr:DEAD/DEAH box helicase [Sandaracinus sp.]MCB9618317.1 DEAD/DEAH box helicase [Sandaracinus sp.]
MTQTPAPEAPTFASLGLSEPVLRAIEEVGWTTPTPVQAECFPLAVEGKDLIVQSRTGTGKTGAFGLPLVDKLVDARPGVQALVLAPTRELALQSARELGKLGAHRGLHTTAVYGGAPMEKQIRELAQGAQIVSGTPGRVLDHLRRGTLDAEGLRVLVLDEADEMLSMGFAKELHAILELLPTTRQTFLFSATVDGPIQRVGERHMKDPSFVTLSGDAVGALTITHLSYMVSGKARGRDLAKILEVEDPESAIIFCNTKAETEQVAAELQRAGFDADWLNGDLPQSERERIMARTRAGELRYLVATDVAARGIDISHLTHVINYALPEHLEQYIHRTGRTGRAGRTGTAITLVAPQELGTLYYLRLQYKIFPIERSLPSAGEERTRRELDRVEMLTSAFGSPSELDRAIARRLLTHPEADRLVAGLVGAFFGPSADTIDDEAAAARRERRPEPAPEPEAPRRGRRREEEESREERREAREESRRERRDERRDERRRDDDEDEEDEGHVRLFVNVGRRDGVRVGDLNRLFQDEAGLEREHVGRIRLRDKHSFVSVPEEKADAVVENLSGKSFAERELKVERAKRN